MKAHQRRKRVGRRRCSKGMIQQQSRKPHCLLAEFDANCGFRGRAVVALVEQQIESALNSGKAPRKFGGTLRVEEPLRACESFLGPGNSFFNCCIGGDEGARNLMNAEAAQDVKYEHDLRFLRQSRMTTGEHHPELLVMNRIVAKHLSNDRSARPFTLKQPAQLRLVIARGPLSAQNIERAILGGGHQPCCRSLRATTVGPHLGSPEEEVRMEVFTVHYIMKPEVPLEYTYHAARLPPKEMFRQFHLHLQLLDWPDFHRTTDFQDRTTLRELSSVSQIGRLDNDVAADHVLGFRVRPVVNDFPLPAVDFARSLQWMSGVLNVTFSAVVL